VLVAGLALAGCSLSPERADLLATHFPEARISGGQLRGWTYDRVLDWADRIKEGADRIRAQSRDPDIRRSALLWKINGIQAFFRGATRRDPIGAFADLWVLSRQMTDFFDSGAGRALFGAQQDVALATARTIESSVESTFAAMFDPKDAVHRLQTARERTADFAKTYPLESLAFRREPLTGHPSTIVAGADQGLGSIVSSMEQDLLTTQRILLAYLEYLPSIARWQAELLLEDAGQTPAIVDGLSLLKDTQGLLRDGLTKQVPEEISRVLTAISGERKAATADLDVMRVATLETLEHERKTITDEVDRQRVATLQQLHDEWKSALQDVRSAGREGASSMLSEGRRWVGAFARKLAALALALLLLVALAAGVLLVSRKLRPVPATPASKVPPESR
jgi:hypothetical protein